MNRPWKRLLILLSFASAAVSSRVRTSNNDLHSPQQLTWQVFSSTGDLVWSITGKHPLWTWWPPLYPSWCKLAAGAPGWGLEALAPDEVNNMLDISPYIDLWTGPQFGQPGSVYAPPPKSDAGCLSPKARAELTKTPFYVCPRDRPLRSDMWKCGDEAHFFCYRWGCETTGQANWNPSSTWDSLDIKWAKGRVATLNITFTQRGKMYTKDWLRTRRWGLRLYVSGEDPGILLDIRLKVEPVSLQVIGPNPVLRNQIPLTRPRPKATTTLRPETFIPTGDLTTGDNLATHLPDAQDRLFRLVRGAFQALNHSNPNLTSECWLCLSMSPPYYEGIAISANFTRDSSHEACSYTNKPWLTLTEVSGEGTCVGKVPPTHEHLCRYVFPADAAPGTTSYLVPPPGYWWACNSGLTSCLADSVINNISDYCVMVQLVPRIYYHPSEELLLLYDHNPRIKREPISLTVAALLGLGVAAEVGTGSAALITGPQQLQQGLTSLNSAISEDIEALEKPISHLEESLTSLSEEVLQNRRGLDLLFLKEGGLCAALKEECCFYLNHSGTIKDSMAKLRERLDKRQRELEATDSWFQSWFNRSPWLTTLLSALAGPLIILLLLFTFGPSVINRLMTCQRTN